MKAGILTYFNVHNHGSSLQALGLKNVLQALGYDVSFLTFERNYDFISAESSKKYKISVASIWFYIKYMFERGIDNIFFNLKKRDVLNKFTNANLPLGGRYSDFEGDLTVIGSDEVFSVEIGINPFFYGIGLQSKKVISYAASFGPTTKEMILHRRIDALLRSGLTSLDAISVRDQNSLTLIEDFVGKTPELVCDPVILYGYKDEQLIFKPEKDEKYIILYSYDKNFRDSSSKKAIQKYAKNHGCKVYSVGYHHRWCDKNICPDPISMLGYFKNSQLIITDTFHGAVVSLITGAQFIVKLSGNKNKLEFLLSEYGLESRIFANVDEIEKASKEKIDYSDVNIILENKRKKSLEYLKRNAL